MFKQYVTLEVRLNDKAVGRAEFVNVQRMVGFLCAVLRVIYCGF